MVVMADIKSIEILLNLLPHKHSIKMRLFQIYGRTHILLKALEKNDANAYIKNKS